MIEELEQHDVDRVIREIDTPVAIDFWMDDCPPCNMMAPKLKAAAEAYKGRVAVYRVRVEEGDALLEQYGIEAMPAILFFRRTEPVARMESLVHSKELEAAFERTASP